MATVSVRYIVHRPQRSDSVLHHTSGFKVEMHPPPTLPCSRMGTFGSSSVFRADSEVAAKPMPDGRRPKSGGSNRFQLLVSDLTAVAETLRRAGVHFRSDLITGIGGNQILLEDPSGNLIELFESV